MRRSLEVLVSAKRAVAEAGMAVCAGSSSKVGAVLRVGTIQVTGMESSMMVAPVNRTRMRPV